MWFGQTHGSRTDVERIKVWSTIGEARWPTSNSNTPVRAGVHDSNWGESADNSTLTDANLCESGQTLLCLANFNQHYIPKFVEIAGPLHNLTKNMGCFT